MFSKVLNSVGLMKLLEERRVDGFEQTLKLILSND